MRKVKVAKFYGISILLMLVALAGIMTCCGRRGEQTYTIGVNQFVTHPLLDAVFQGIVVGLKEKGLSEDTGCNIMLKNANGDQSVAFLINKQFVDQNVSMIIPIATPPAQSACKVTKEIPIVFAAITDPVKAGIANSYEKPGGNKTGTSDRWPYAEQVGLIKTLVPTAKNVGMIMNPGEANTQASLEFIRPVLKKLGLNEVAVPVSNTAEVYGAAKSLVGRCDVILVPADNTVVSAFDAVVKVANENKIPLFVGSSDCVEKGAIATYGVNYFEIGRSTGHLAARILKNKLRPGDIPVVVESKADLIINLKAAEAQGVAIPENLISKAKKVIR